jgi:predicted dehydrogenase
MSHLQPSRRRLLAQGAALAAWGAAPSILRAQSRRDKVRLVFIGVGGRGLANIQGLLGVSLAKGATGQQAAHEVVAICDVNAQNLERAQAAFPKAAAFRDFRELYSKVPESSYDAVVVSTTEHTHAYATAPALRLRKAVYCEKPLTRDVAEARLITQLAQQAGVVTQMGTQIHGMPNYRRVVELVQSGAIGKVNEVHVCVSRAWGLQSKEEAARNKDVVFVTERPKEAQTPPPYLDWDLWLGPAPWRPFHEVYFPGPKWYRWWDFGNGTMSDLGSHWNDLPFWALNLDAPKLVEAEGPPPHPEIAPASMSVTYHYGARGDMPACRVHWHQGERKPQLWKDHPLISKWASGVLFVGEGGMLLSDYSKHVLLPEEKFVNFQRPKPFLADSPGQHQEWLLGILEGKPTGSPFSYAGALSEANHLGNVAHRAGGRIEWDSKAMRITNNAAANAFLSREPRAGWSLQA